MFQADSSILIDSIEQLRNHDKGEYFIQINDVITIQIYTNNGETLVDPNNELKMTSPSSKESPVQIKYTVYADGNVTLPMIGKIQLAGLNIVQVDSLLSIKYGNFYTAPFVKTTVLSKRVIVFGPDGGKIIPLDYQGINLIEVIAKYGGIKLDGKSNNIRVIRGDLKNPDVQLVDLSTIEGLKLAYTDIEPGDIVYIEPKRRILKDVITDIMPFATMMSSLATVIILIKTVKL